SAWKAAAAPAPSDSPRDAVRSGRNNRMSVTARTLAMVAALGALAVAVGVSVGSRALPNPQPTFSDLQLVSASTTPPTQAQCFSVGRRCFGPGPLQAAYN